jgi:uncharacterized protein YcnI
MRLRLLAATATCVATLLASAAPAWAHVTTDPDAAPKGGELTLRFRVPNEVTNTNVVKVDIAFPTDHPLLGVAVEPVAGWTSTVTEVQLNPPVQTDDGPVTQAVGEIVWNATTGGGTAPGQFQEFPVLVQRLPTDTDQSVFKTVQTYGDGTVVRWIDPVVAGQAAPEHPTPILRLTGSVDTNSSAAGGSTVDVTKLAKKSSVSTASALGVIGIVVGALGLVVAVLALRRRTGADVGTSKPSSTP